MSTINEATLRNLKTSELVCHIDSLTDDVLSENRVFLIRLLTEKLCIYEDAYHCEDCESMVVTDV